ncbi:hypothetical protein CCACVL1_10471 [Corchorus capsularis]|uniref:Uncharacterized protein n=1 Tax=Corchorus capsularis TaxID=210143 RepID=A0A1R3IR19_COCAP|nr:hypothetical protein CCACVL1_10471 [Corchorus capsularis]
MADNPGNRDQRHMNVWRESKEHTAVAKEEADRARMDFEKIERAHAHVSLCNFKTKSSTGEKITFKTKPNVSL